MRKQLRSTGNSGSGGLDVGGVGRLVHASDNEVQPGMSMAERQDATEGIESDETVTAEIVDIDGTVSLLRRRMVINWCYSSKVTLVTSTSVTSWS